MKTKELIEALKVDAEWAEGHEYDAPICLREHLLEAAKILNETACILIGNCEFCKYWKIKTVKKPADARIKSGKYIKTR